MSCVAFGKVLIHDGEEGDGPLVVEVLEITVLRDMTYQPLTHP